MKFVQEYCINEQTALLVKIDDEKQADAMLKVAKKTINPNIRFATKREFMELYDDQLSAADEPFLLGHTIALGQPSGKYMFIKPNGELDKISEDQIKKGHQVLFIVE